MTDDDDDDVSAAIPRLRNPWLSKFLKTQGLALLGLLISLSMLTAYCINYFWKPDNLVVYFRFVDPQEVGTNQLHLNYVFSNAGKTPVFIEDVSLTEVFYHEDGNKNVQPIGFCNDKNIFTPETFALTPTKLRSKPYLYSNEGRYGKLYTPKAIYLGSAQSPFSSLNVDAGAQRAISAVFEMDALDWNKFNVVLICPIIRLFDSSGHPFTAICDGFQSDQFPVAKDMGYKATRTIPGGLARLLPTSSSNCRIAPY